MLSANHPKDATSGLKGGSPNGFPLGISFVGILFC
jgi:hypothetical protein